MTRMKYLVLVLFVSLIFHASGAGAGEELWGTSVGVIAYVAGEAGIADIPDPRDLDNNGVYNEASDTVTCGSRCSFESSTGNKWVHDSTTSTWRCVTCRAFYPPMFNAKVSATPSGGNAAESCVRLWGVHDLALATRLACTSESVEIFLMTADSVAEAGHATFTLERLCFMPWNVINADRGGTFWISDDSNSTKIAKVEVPEVQSTTLAVDDVACSNDTPVRIDSAQGNRIVLVSQDGPNCADGSGCHTDGLNGFLTVLVMEI